MKKRQLIYEEKLELMTLNVWNQQYLKLAPHFFLNQGLSLPWIHILFSWSKSLTFFFLERLRWVLIIFSEYLHKEKCSNSGDLFTVFVISCCLFGKRISKTQSISYYGSSMFNMTDIGKGEFLGKEIGFIVRQILIQIPTYYLCDHQKFS